jgi:hypothetical protein
VNGQTQLLQIVGAAHAVGSLTHFLDGWNQQTNQNRNDGYHHQQFNQGKTDAAGIDIHVKPLGKP